MVGRLQKNQPTLRLPCTTVYDEGLSRTRGKSSQLLHVPYLSVLTVGAMNTGCAAVKRRGRSPRPRIRRAQGGSNMSEGVHPSPSGMAPGSPAATNGFRGGVTIAVLALLLVAMTFYISSPL